MIKLIVFDFDGVFTNGKIIFNENGIPMKHYNAKDGMGILRLHDAGFEVGVISGWPDNISQQAILKHLKIKRVSLGSNSKLDILNQWCKELNIKLQNVAYMGDDINDLEVMKEVSLVGCPNDAVDEVKQIANLVCDKCGGNGAVREFCEYIVKSELEEEENTLIPILNDIKNEFSYQIKNFPIENIYNLAELINDTSGNIYFCGVGKSGNIAKHCCDLLKCISINTFSFDILNSIHGDIGTLKKKDIIIIFSNSGNTTEIINLASSLKNIKLKIIGVTCSEKSMFDNFCDIVINLPYKSEIHGNINKIPTNSVMSQIVFCNILVSIMKKNISLEEYRLNHSSGNIGKLLHKIKDVLITDYAKIYFENEIKLHDVYMEMINKKMGCCFFLKPNNELIGLITDGDIRRNLIKDKSLDIITEDIINKDFYYECDSEKYISECNNNFTYIPILIDKILIGIVSNVPC